jgi:predicted DNA-binding transcriptional regulator YafY
LALYFWGGAWTLAAWCELRNDFRVFRIDRMQEVDVLGREFVQKKGQRLEDFVKQAGKPPYVSESAAPVGIGRG